MKVQVPKYCKNTTMEHGDPLSNKLKAIFSFDCQVVCFSPQYLLQNKSRLARAKQKEKREEKQGGVGKPGVSMCIKKAHADYFFSHAAIKEVYFTAAKTQRKKVD